MVWYDWTYAEGGQSVLEAWQAAYQSRLPCDDNVSPVNVQESMMLRFRWAANAIGLSIVVGAFLLPAGCSDSPRHSSDVLQENLGPNDPGYEEAARKAIDENREDLPHLFPKQ
jgi:hypothetical protein